ncbi:DUF87 domain-containing protein [Sesbania bispinosa]|nr:DUF87 domain-containing protein [Sesbania bispinosa]
MRRVRRDTGGNGHEAHGRGAAWGDSSGWTTTTQLQHGLGWTAGGDSSRAAVSNLEHSQRRRSSGHKRTEKADDGKDATEKMSYGGSQARQR